MKLVTINPATEEKINEYDELSDAEVDTALQRAALSFDSWRRQSFKKRSQLLLQAADVLESKKRNWTELITHEMGKPITESDAEIEKCVRVCRYYAENAERFLEQEMIETDAGKSYVRYQPLGVILAVMPWNFPFWQVFRFAAPTLMAGNVGVLKHSSNVPGCGIALEQIFKEAEFPESVFINLLISSARTERVINNPIVKAVTLTGSGSAGGTVAAIAGAAKKKTVLELGGSDPFIILDDADIAASSATAADSRMLNAGQSCISAKRFIVVASRYEEFIAEFTRHISSRTVGDPMDPKTTVGPLAREDLRAALHKQVTDSLALGARLLCGGNPKSGKGYFYEPTVVADVTKGMPLYDEETFGPAAAVIKATDEADAIRIANDTIYGLGASLWTNDRAKAEQLAGDIEAGAVFINGLVKSDPRLPFGGIKQSGYGRELGKHGIMEFVNKKTVWVGRA